MTETPPSPEIRPAAGPADWVLMAVRWLLGLGLLLLNRLTPPNPTAQALTEYILIGYLLFTLLETLFLWRRWALGLWPHLTLALDIGLVLAVLFLHGGSRSPLLPLLLLPLVAVSLRLGFSAGLGLNLAGLAGYGLLLAGDWINGTPPDVHKTAAMAGAILLTGLFGLAAEHLGRPAQETLRRFQEEAADLQARYQEASRQAQVFYEMAQTLSLTLSYQKVLEGVLDDCRRLVDFSVGVVLLSAGPEDLFVAASSGLRVGDAEKGIHLSGNGQISAALATAEPTLLEHLGRDEELAQVMALQRCRSGMLVPLRAGLRNYGAIVLGALSERAYTPADLEQLASLAHFATIAIQNAQLYQDLREERDKILRAEENVRRELSRDLHDGPAQSLAAIAMSVEYIKRLLSQDPARALAELDSLEQLARKTSWDIRTMLFELRPIILETQGLVPTLEQYVQRFPASEGIQIHLDAGNFSRRLDPKTEATVFIIMQEAVNNARKHARAKNIWLRLREEGENLVASVQDDGVGFDLEAVRASYERRGSFGLLNMEERARLVGGRTEIRSAPGRGTAVIISVPLESR
ncbi:MAG: GAF domain-containing sensor histidine kinase [Chloroflexia bacterium]